MGVNWRHCIPAAGYVTSVVAEDCEHRLSFFVDADICWKCREVGQHGRGLSASVNTRLLGFYRSVLTFALCVRC
jgi:hypothetical protein